MAGMIAATITSGIFILVFVSLFAGGVKALLITAGILGIMYLLSKTEFAESVVIFLNRVNFYNSNIIEYVRNIIQKHIPADKIPGDLRVGVVNIKDPNAFAVGRRTIAVTTGLLDVASEEEIAGVIGHELGHLANQDGDRFLAILFMYQPGIIAANVINFFLMVLTNIGGRMSGGLGWIIVAPLYYIFILFCRVLDWITTLVLMKSSREAEYRADAYSAGLSPACRAGLVSFLGKLQSMEGPAHHHSIMAALMASHPPTADRIARLKSGTAVKSGAAASSGSAAFSGFGFSGNPSTKDIERAKIVIFIGIWVVIIAGFLYIIGFFHRPHHEFSQNKQDDEIRVVVREDGSAVTLQPGQDPASVLKEFEEEPNSAFNELDKAVSDNPEYITSWEGANGNNKPA